LYVRPDAEQGSTDDKASAEAVYGLFRGAKEEGGRFFARQVRLAAQIKSHGRKAMTFLFIQCQYVKF
jgi:hypothetical protein